MGNIIINVTEDSFPSNDKTKAIIEKTINKYFLWSRYFIKLQKLRLPNKKEIISSLLLILATTSVSNGWTAKNKIIKKDIVLVLSLSLKK